VRSLEASCDAVSFTHIDKQLIPDGGIENVSLQLAVEAEGVIKVESKARNDRLGKCVQRALARYLEGPIDFRLKRRTKFKSLSFSHLDLAP
jgi:hypothetical protein